MADATTDGWGAVLKSLAMATITIIALFGLSICVGALQARYRLTLTPPFPLKVVSLLLPVMVGATWFRLKFNRTMSHRELTGYAAGMAILDVAAASLPMALMSLIGFRVSLSFYLSVFAINILFGLATGYLFGWILTRRRAPARLT